MEISIPRFLFANRNHVFPRFIKIHLKYSLAFLLCIGCNTGQNKDIKETKICCPEKPVVTEKDSAGNIIHTKFDVDPHYPGRFEDWKKFLKKNLNSKIAVSYDSIAKYQSSSGTYTVVISVYVDTSGHIFALKPLTNFGNGMEEEAMRVIRLSGKWVPAMLDGKKVIARSTWPITFNAKKDL